MRLIIVFISVLALTGCAGGHHDLKSPCSPSASLSQNPCMHIPLNIAALDSEKEKSS